MSVLWRESWGDQLGCIAFEMPEGYLDRKFQIDRVLKFGRERMPELEVKIWKSYTTWKY